MCVIGSSLRHVTFEPALTLIDGGMKASELMLTSMTWAVTLDEVVGVVIGVVIG